MKKMKELRDSMLLYLVTDRSWLGTNTLSNQVEAGIKSGVTMVQMREKNLTYEEFVAEAKEIKKVTDRYQIPLIINDRIDVARVIDAQGVHLGEKDEDIVKAKEILGSDKIIGLSAHNVGEAVRAQKRGANYIGVGAVFGSSTKLDACLLAYETLRDICSAVTIPVVAIGGINSYNISDLSGSGISGVAVISGILGKADISKATKEMYELARKVVAR